ncbi:MAG: molybdopterin-binding protein [Alphaproteobacteria bacterium]|nr:molybdopterin-binding protein [Alphaproteobacteria bacterium]
MADDRRRFLTRSAAVAAAALLSGCSGLSEKKWVSDALSEVENLTRRAQRLFAGRQALAPEFTKADIAPVFRANGTLDPASDDYRAHAAKDFRDWRVEVGGLVERPLSLSMEALRAMPSRTQITRHDCVEGWSCIGEWKGTPLRLVLAEARPRNDARYVAFFCADNMAEEGVPAQYYYESLDLVEATHPQTLLAYELNGQALPIEHGAPVRLRAERQLGYKMAKYIQRIEIVADLGSFGGGRGGYWEDQGYSWYAGI